VQVMGQANEIAWNRKAKVIAVIGNLIRYFEFETLVKPFADRILKIMVFIGKDNQTLVREFFVHHCSLLTKRLSSENSYPKFFSTIFQTCFHQMLTDIKTNERVLTSLGNMLCF
jgi:hypothetical protein